MSQGVDDYVIRVSADPHVLPLQAWNDLLLAQPSPTPFMRLEYLQALHDSGSAVAATGWQPQFLSVWHADSLVAACPAYLKSHSYGEYVFDWAWADAYARHGLPYYPKLLVAVPFTPVPGTRLLARDDRAREVLVQGLQGLADRLQLSSAHVLFGSDEDMVALEQSGWLPRHNVQFHWQNLPGQAPQDFGEFLASLQREKRKKIQQEQRRVRDAGISYAVCEGPQISQQDWDFFYRCYALTYEAHRSTPYLSRSFFAQAALQMPDNWLMFVAYRAGQRVAASLIALDPVRRIAYGRYWGCVEAISCLHFDACYYQPLAWCMARTYQRFEGGAQGEHKMARGLLPVGTRSAHRLAHPQFRDAVAEFLAREGGAMHEYVNELEQRRPFKTA